MLWQQAMGSTGNDDVAWALETANGDYVIAGDVAKGDGDNRTGHGGDDVWVVKLAQNNGGYANNCGTARIFPNPNNGSLRIVLSAGQAQATVQAYSTLGCLVATNTETGLYRYLDLTAAASGIYFLKINDPGGATCITRIIKQ